MPNKIIFNIIIFLALFNTVYSQEYWFHVPSPTDKLLMKCSFPDSVFGWAAGDSGTIINTTNSGLTWNLQNSGITNYYIDDIFFLNQRLGWAVSNDYFFNGTTMLSTTNGGINWLQSTFPDTTVIISCIYYIDSLHGFASGFSGYVFRTTNGGTNWLNCYMDTTGCPYLAGFPKNRIRFVNNTTGFLAGGQMDIQGIVWKTTDGGANFRTYCLTPEPLFDVKIINSEKIIACGGDFEFGAITSTTFNSGANWRYKNIELMGVARDLAFRTETEAWMPLSFAQAWAVSLDSASSFHPWISVPAPDSTAVYTCVFKSPTFGFAFGSYGSILKYNTSVIGIIPGSNSPAGFKLGQNYPNPFNPETKINYSLPNAQRVVFTIYDLLGKTVKVFYEGMRPPGFNTFSFSSNGLSSGIYIYKLQAGSFTESRKMVIIK